VVLLAHDRLMWAQWSSEPGRALVSGGLAMSAYREAILRNPTSPYPYLAWEWALESVSRLAAWAAENRVPNATFDDIEGNLLSHLITHLASQGCCPVVAPADADRNASGPHDRLRSI
jgi:hypothetical protein